MADLAGTVHVLLSSEIEELVTGQSEPVTVPNTGLWLSLVIYNLGMIRCYTAIVAALSLH